MKKTILTVAASTLLAAALIVLPSPSRAADDSDAKTPAANAAGATKFYGPVTAVDTNAMTFTVNDQVFTITSASQMTKGTNSATLADAVVGEPARGSYVKDSDGKLNITKVRFGKKTGGKGGGKSGGKKKAAASDTSTNAPAATPPN